jgi:hypothetical protein
MRILFGELAYGTRRTGTLMGYGTNILHLHYFTFGAAVGQLLIGSN